MNAGKQPVQLNSGLLPRGEFGGGSSELPASRRNQRRSPPGAYRYRLLCDPGNRARSHRLGQPPAVLHPHQRDCPSARARRKCFSLVYVDQSFTRDCATSSEPLLPPFANRLKHTHTIQSRLIPTDPRFHPVSSNGSIVICRFLRVPSVVRNVRCVVLPLG